QMPHINRAGLSESLGLDEGAIRVISPDVGGGFGYKGVLLVEEVCLAWLARHLRRPVRWIEDRREQLTANANCREHDYDITLDAVAREAGREPYEVRLANLVQPHEMPYDNITRKHFDSGDYPEAVRRAAAALDVNAWRARQKNGEPDARRIGIGFSIYCEQAA